MIDRRGLYRRGTGRRWPSIRRRGVRVSGTSHGVERSDDALPAGGSALVCRRRRALDTGPVGRTSTTLVEHSRPPGPSRVLTRQEGRHGLNGFGPTSTDTGP
ncbi:hypothetical protein DV733_08175 [Halapricum salinum]|uniref:Uncharacterized protein n=1 Tax=Halapricum salinum TaxID=1457250 RepID=A0A4D6HBN6_9EURY|nr:hypothetical protein DV733_08175 [Halapricum salinum]